MNLITTLPGSLMENFFPAGWDLARIDRLGAIAGPDLEKRQSWWHPQFEPKICSSFEDFDTFMGHEIAREIQLTRQAGRPLAIILPVGPMGMYRWTVYFLKEWGVGCDHVHGFNMDEWSDAQGNTLPSDNTGAFQYAMEQAFYGPLGKLTVPPKQRHFALKTELPSYGEQIGALKKQGAKLVTVFGIGRVCHIAFWEPHFAGEFAGLEDWKKQTHRLGARLHPLTDRTKRPDQLQEPHDPGAGLRQHDRPGPVPGGGPDHRRCRRRLQPRHAVAGPVAAHDPAPRADAVDSQHLHADAGGAVVLCERAGGAVGGGVQLDKFS